MSTITQISKQLSTLYFGGNYTGVNYTDVLKDVSFEQAITKIEHFNTIHTLLFHTQYYMDAVINVLEGNVLDASDSLSFVHEPIQTKEAWNTLLDTMFSRVKVFASIIEKLSENTLYTPFEKVAYGTYYRNIVGVIEHSHYHLGQIVFLKKMI